MNQRKTVFLTLLGLTAVSGLLIAAADVATAPSAPAPSATAQRVKDAIHDRIVEQLGLSADQQKQIDALKAKQQAELEALKADKSLPPEQRREKARAVMQGYREQMRAVLTPEQQKQAAALRERFARRMGERGAGRPESRPVPPAAKGPGDNPMAVVAMGERIKDRLAEKLQLTDEQRDKLEHLGRAYRAQQRELAKRHQEEMRAVLTPEQQEKAKKLFRHPRAGGPQGRRFGDAGEPRLGPPDGPEFAGPDFGPGAPGDDLDAPVPGEQ